MRTVFKTFLISILLLELASLAGFFVPEIREAAFFAVLLVAFIASLQRLEYGLYILFAELAIGSKGYLLWYTYDGIDVSLRIALFFIVMCVWLGKAVIDWMSIEHAPLEDIDPFLLRGKTWKELPKHVRDTVRGLPQRSGKGWGVYGWYGLLCIALGWGALNGYLQGNGVAAVFLDANGWLYFAVVFPFAHVLKRRNGEEGYAQRLAAFWRGLVAAVGAGVAWLTVKTLILLYVFSHTLPYAAEIYRWVRVTGVGEITRMESGFTRVFVQSHVWGFFALFGVLAVMLWLAVQRKYKKLLHCYIATLLLSAIVVLGFSRSFWAGLAVGVAVYGVTTLWIYRKEWKAWLLHAGMAALAGISSLALVWGIVAFPFPDPTARFDVDTLKDRTNDIDDEAAASSRWQLLPVLWQEIKEAPLQGKGFGETVTYISDDPRVREQNPSGEYTTFAFEWGWLDVWLKLGLGGLLVYVGLLGGVVVRLIQQMMNDECRMMNGKCRLIAISLFSALIFLAATHAVSPYLNHPLGIGFVVAVAAWAESAGKKESTDY